MNYKKGDMVFSEGDTDNSLYVIVHGNFEVVSTSPNTGEKISFFYAGEGLVFGELAFLDSQPRSAAIVAIQPSEVLKLTRQGFDELLENQPKVAARFMFSVSEILSRRLRGAYLSASSLTPNPTQKNKRLAG
jgi:CRP-like cAMP-binding protein